MGRGEVHDLRLRNLSHPAYLKELQNYFDVYLLSMTFLKNRAHWLNCPLPSLSFLQVTSPPSHTKTGSAYTCSFIDGFMEQRKQDKMLLYFFIKNLTFLYYEAKGIMLLLYHEGFKLEGKKKQKENLNAGLWEEKKNEGRDFLEHFNRACWIMCSG